MAAKEPRAEQHPGPYGLAEIRGLAKILSQYDLSELELEQNGQRIHLRRDRGLLAASPTLVAPATEQPLPPVVAPSAPAPVEPADDGSTLITSPFVGTFYRAPSPESPPFVEVGATVSKGQVLCIVEAMKLMNEIEAETNCKILEVLVKNAEPVEFGQPLFKVFPLA